MLWQRDALERHPNLAPMVANLLYLASHLRPLEKPPCHHLLHGLENLLLTAQLHLEIKRLNEAKAKLLRELFPNPRVHVYAQHGKEPVSRYPPGLLQRKRDGLPDDTTNRLRPLKKGTSEENESSKRRFGSKRKP
jgi:hypothetical protein